MKFKFLKFDIKKIICVIGALTILMASLPLGAFSTRVRAAEGNIIDFEGLDALDIVDGNAAFSIAGIDDPDKYYFYGKNNTSDTLSLTFDDIQLETGKKYTLDMDIYTLRMSEDSDNKLLGLKVYGENETSLEVNVNNDVIIEENWANYHTEFTAKETTNKLDFSIFTIGKVFVDNFVLIDENGNETALDFAAACEATELKNHFSAATLYDIANEEPDIIDGYLKAAVPENPTMTYNEKVDIPMNLSEPLEEGRYTMSIDLKFTALGSNTLSFCASIAGNNVGTIQHFIEANSITPNRYYTYTYDFDLTSDYSWFRFHVYQGCTAYIDNVVLMDAAGQEVVKFDFDEAVNFNGAAFEQKGIAKSKSTMAYSLRNVARTTTSTASDDYAFLIDNSNGTGNITFTSNQIGQPYPITDAGTYTVEIDFYALSVGNQIFSFVPIDSNWGSMQQYYTDSAGFVANEWVTLSFTTTATNAISFWRMYLGAGVKGYIDNVRFIDSSGNEVVNFAMSENENGKTVDNVGTVVALPMDIAEAKGSDEPEAPELSDDYAFLIDNSNGTGNITFTSNQIGQPYPITEAGTYTVEIDFYALSVGNQLFSFVPIDSNWGSMQQYYTDSAGFVANEWVTLSFTTTATSAISFWRMYLGAGVKGYIDNVRFIDSSGNEVVNFAMSENENGKTVDNVGTVVALPMDIAEAKGSDEPEAPELSDDYAFLIDNSNGTGNITFTSNQIGQPYPITEAGTYTVEIDFYALSVGNQLFSFTALDSNWKSLKQHYTESAGYVANEWVTLSFDITTTSAISFWRMYLGAGVKGYIDNVRFIDSSGNEVVNFAMSENENGKTVDNVGTVVALPMDIAEAKGSDEPEVPENSNDYAILVDNSAGTSFGKLYLHEVGMPSPSAPAGTYTVEYDFYALSVGNCTIPYAAEKTDWSSSAIGQVWKDNLPLVENEWVTISFTATATDIVGYQMFWIGAGIKGYMDNFKLIASDGTVYSNFEMTANELGKASQNINTVVELPMDVADAKNPDDSGDLDEPEDILTSGMNIAVLRGRAGKNGASIKLGGEKSPLTIKSNTSYKLSFKYYQANPTDSGILNLFGINTGFGNDVAYFKKNNSTGWTTGTVLFTTGDVTNASADWLEIILNANAWVYFDDFKLVEQAVDNNKEVNVIDFEQKDDSIYPDATVENCTFGQTTDFGGTSNGSNGYFCANNATEYTNDSKNSNRGYTFNGIKFKSNTTYRVSIDYYVSKPFDDYAFAFGYNAKDLGAGSAEASWQVFVNNKSVIGWHTASFTVTTGEVVPNASYIKLAFYDVLDSANPRVIYFDNLTLTELYRIDSNSNNSDLGTVSSTVTVEAGSDSKVVANPYEGVTFEGWYEYGDLVSTDEIYRIENVNDNHNLVAHFSGTPVKPERIVQGFEDYDLGDILYEYYEIVDDPENVLEGKQSLHVKADKIEVNADHSLFFPLVSNVEAQLKEDTEYDVYIWIKPTKKPESTTYFQIVHSTGIADMSDLLTSPGGSGMQRSIAPSEATALEVKDGWCKYLIGTVTKSLATRQGYGIQVCKFHAFRAEGASIDDMYIDMVELVERVPDYANLKFTENLFNEITNSDFEDAVTNEDWAPLTDGVSIENVTNKEYDWQGSKQMVFDAAASNGQEYVRVIPIVKADKNYTFAAWTKLSAGSDISVGLYKNGNYEVFENVVNGENGTLGLIDDGKWNRVSFTFNSGDAENAYLVIKGTKGTLELDMVEMFIATRGYTTDPNSYGITNPVFQMTNPIAFPDIIRTETTYIENEDEDDTQDDTYIESDDNEDEETDDDNNDDSTKKKKKKRVVKVVKPGGTSAWIWIGIGAGALALIAAVVFIILFAKRKKTKKEAK